MSPINVTVDVRSIKCLEISILGFTQTLLSVPLGKNYIILYIPYLYLVLYVVVIDYN